MAESFPIPAAAERDPQAIHMVSLWLAEGGLHCNVRLGVYENHPSVTETQAWGTILADVVRVITEGLIANGSEKGPHADVANRIWTAFHEQMTKSS